MSCPGCLKENETGFCLKCRKELFDGKNVSPVLPFHSPYKEDSEVYLRLTEKISISGVQVKYSLKLVGNELRLTDTGGEYILKPVPTGTFRNLDQAPANEHLTMQIARQVYKIITPPNALISFLDDSPAYLVRRFDKTPNGKRQQEDFGQIARMTSETHGDNYKYELSYEEIAGLIKQFIPAYPIQIEKFFRLILFNYVFSNGDAHIRNFSAILSEQGDYLLSPAYDLLCTRIHSPGESYMALTLFKDRYTSTYEAYGFYTYQDFYEFGQLVGIKPSRVRRIIEFFSKPHEQVYTLITRSFLNEEVKHDYQAYYADKLNRLSMK